MKPQLEVCVDTIYGALNAVQGGADRIELCSALSEGGLTPSIGLMREAAKLPVPVFAMIRPRAGAFSYSAKEEAIMAADIAAAKQAGLDGVVLGAQNDDGRLNIPMLKRLIDAADGMGLTLHRVIDVLPDPLRALEDAITLGFDRILTSGGAKTATDGADQIAAMVARANKRISIMAGAGVTAQNARDLVSKTGVHELHASCSRAIQDETALGFTPSGGRRETHSRHVRDLAQVLRPI